MKVIFVKDIENHGRKGETKEVSDGFGRNFLIPKGIAMEATQQNIKKLKETEKIREKKRERKITQAKDIKNKLKEISVTIQAKAGQDDKLFGAVTSENIAEELKKQSNIEIDKHQFVLEQPIKKLGIYKVPVKLSENIEAELKIWVVREQ
jgi:large subunit ribosomal protein L9